MVVEPAMAAVCPYSVMPADSLGFSTPWKILKAAIAPTPPEGKG